MSSDNAIRVEDLTKVYRIYDKPHHRLLQAIAPGPSERWFREFSAIKGMDLAIARGETVGIVGRNGSGKSTLLQLICGTLTPTRGRVVVDGRIAALLELGAGFNPEFTGRENVYLYATVLGMSRAETDARFADIAKFADIGSFMDQPVKNYSSGMYVRLAFAVAIHVEPDILVVDEALSVGDEAFQRKCFARIDAIRERGATILFVSHSASTIVELCDRAVLVDRGEMLAVGPPREVVASYQKLLYAPAERVDALREEIRATYSGARVEARRHDVAATNRGDAPLAPTTPALEAYFDPGMVAQGTIAYENKGARIGEPMLRTADGRRVNVLVPGEVYEYHYNVDVERTLQQVRCGMMIRSITGVEIAGAGSATLERAIPIVDKGTRLSVVFRFRCLLAPGTYFLNAGILEMGAEGEDYVDRRIDVVMFRVMPDLDRVATGFVDLDVVPHVGVDA